MKNIKVIKIIGFVASLVGVAATLIGNATNAKLLDHQISEKVNEALSKNN